MNIKNLIKKIYQELRNIKCILSNLNNISAIFKDSEKLKSYYPDEPQKSKIEMYFDLLIWLLRNKEVNEFYFLYGFDTKSKLETSSFVPYKLFMEKRNEKNFNIGTFNNNYTILLRDKFLFSQYVKSLGFSTPEIKGIVDKEKIYWINKKQEDSLGSLINFNNSDAHYFCKSLSGECGEGVFKIDITGNGFFVNNELSTIEQFKVHLNGKYFLQETIYQHEKMSQLYPHSINTLRLQTVFNDKKPECFYKILRIGAKGNFVDNWAKGGLIVKIDSDTGNLADKGLFKPGYGQFAVVHPDTNVKLADFNVPYFNEAVEMVEKLHEYFYGVHTIGWDIAITPEGPCVIEGNDNWEITLLQSLDRNGWKDWVNSNM
jgi:hypothetical protein